MTSLAEGVRTVEIEVTSRREDATAAHARLEEIARRHLGMVYSVALREVGDPNLAEDVTQAVFLVLARKGRLLRPGTVLAGWLFKTTRYCALDARKRQTRRHRYEREAAVQAGTTMRQTSPANEAEQSQMAGMINSAVASLKQRDREVVLLRFFEARSIAEIADDVGMSQEAVRKQVSRAVAKLREYFVRKGVELAPAASALEMLIGRSAQSTTAPSELLGKTLLAGSGQAIGPVVAIAKGAMRMMTMVKLKFVAMVVGGAFVLGGGGTVLVQQVLYAGKAPAARMTTSQPAASAASSQPARDFEAGIEVDLFSANVAGAACALNFENGEPLTQVEAMRRAQAAAGGAMPQNIADAGIDILGAISTRQPPMLVGYGMKVTAAPATAWDVMSPEELRQRLKAVKERSPNMMMAQRLPTTYLFQTSRGRLGILRILKVGAEEPRSIHFQYKLLPADASAATQPAAK